MVTENSDIDLIVVYEQPLTTYREKLRWNGWLLDTFVFDAEAIHGSMILARNNGNSVLAHSIKNAEIISLSDSSLMERIRHLSIRIADAPPLARSLENQRQLLTGLIDDFGGLNDAQSKIFVLSEIFHSLIDIILSKYGESGGSKRYAARLLRAKDPQLLDALAGSYEDAIGGSPDGFVTLAKATLHIAGGELREGFRMKLPETLRIPIDCVG